MILLIDFKWLGRMRHFDVVASIWRSLARGDQEDNFTAPKGELCPAGVMLAEYIFGNDNNYIRVIRDLWSYFNRGEDVNGLPDFIHVTV